MNDVPEQPIAIIEADIGVDVEIPILLETGLCVLTLGASGIWSSVKTDGAASAFVSDFDESRARIDVGFRFSGDDNMVLSVKASADGLGGEGAQAYGLEGLIELKF